MSLFSSNNTCSWDLYLDTQRKLDEANLTLLENHSDKFEFAIKEGKLRKDIKTLLDIIINHREMTEEEKDHFAEEYQEYFVKNIVRKSLDSKEK